MSPKSLLHPEWERPPCPQCNSINIIGKGKDWQCKCCGRWFSKQYNPRTPNKPKCRYCNSDNVWSKDPNWWCNSCRRYWSKEYKINNLPDIILSEHDRGWVEALIDGEGWLGLYKSNYKGINSRKNEGSYKWNIKLGISMTSKECLDKFYEIVGTTKPYEKKVKKRHLDGKMPKRCYSIDVTANKLRVLLPQIRLIVKEKQRILMLEALELLYLNQRDPKRFRRKNDIRLNEIYYIIRKLNKKGISTSSISSI